MSALGDLTDSLIERNKFGAEHPYELPDKDWLAVRDELADVLKMTDRPMYASLECDRPHFLVMGTPIVAESDVFALKHFNPEMLIPPRAEAK